MIRNIPAAFLLAASFFSPSLYAAEVPPIPEVPYRFEVSGSTNVGAQMLLGTSFGFVFSIGADVYGSLHRNIQVGISSASAFGFSAGTTIMGGTVIALLGFTGGWEDLSSDFFFRAGPGLSNAYVSSDGVAVKLVRFAGAFEAGKRFHLLKNVSYTPSVSLALAIGSVPTLSFNLIKFSIFF